MRRFKGHQNTSKNFVRAGFGPDESLVVGGSEVTFIFWIQAHGSCLAVVINVFCKFSTNPCLSWSISGWLGIHLGCSNGRDTSEARQPHP